MRRFARTGLVTAAGILVSGCGPCGPIEVEQEDPIQIVREIKEDPSFRSDIQVIFNSNGCVNGACHGVDASAGLALEEGLAHAFLVEVDATQERFQRVTPENVPDSYLIIRLEGRQTVGERMPLGGILLDTIEVTNLENRINRGAKNN